MGARRNLVGVGLFVVVLTSSLFAQQSASRSTPKERITADTIVYVTKTGAKYHTATCRHLSRSKIPMKLGAALDTYGACSVCKPPILAKPAGPTPAGIVSAPASPAPARPATASRLCAAITKKGTRCSRTAAAGSAYCWQHK